MSEPKVIECDDLDATIEEYKELGYRLDMIFPADNPREALLWRDGGSVRLLLQKPARSKGIDCHQDMPLLRAGFRNGRDVSSADWIVGRAGMEYRDLIPGRLDGKIIASHIRLTKGGEVPDYVHYHKVDFQMIYCKRGRIKVVYEDQGPPFWLETGDCVLQPPKIRHRVLECTAGAEVIEVSMPAEHETWVEHDITLPTNELKPDRIFNGQTFFHYKAANDTAETDYSNGEKSHSYENYCIEFADRLLTFKAGSSMSGNLSQECKELCRTFAEMMA